MAKMYKALPAVLAVALAAIAPAPPTAVAIAATPAPAATRTAPPQIYHIITRPLCSELHKHIAPAMSMMMQSDHNIGKSPDLFKNYNKAALYGADNSTSNNAGYNPGNPSNGGAAQSIYTPAQNMALLGMENLIGPIANNSIAIQKMLDSPELTHGTGSPEDDQRLADIRAKLLKAEAAQQASLDIISGFVDTQQLADLQHSGQEYIASVNQHSDFVGSSAQSTPTPNPAYANPNQAGLPQNPYGIDLANVPGLTLGYNPVTRLLEGLNWTISETQKREGDAAKAVLDSAALCASAPVNHPKPN
jgi:hypothetical protein